MDPFFELVSSMYSVNWLVVSSETAKQSLKSRVSKKTKNSDSASSLPPEDYSISDILSSYSTVDNVNGIVRDGKDQVIRIDKLRLKFVDQLDIKSRPSIKVVEKSLYDLVANYKNSPEILDKETRHTPWYTDWRQEFLSKVDPNTDPAEPKEFAGSMAGIIFVMDPQDIANYQEVMNTLLAEAKSLAGVRWLFSSQIKYIIVIDFNSSTTSNAFAPSHEPVNRDESIMPGPPVSMDSKWAELSQTYYAFRLHLAEECISINKIHHTHSHQDLSNHHHSTQNHQPVDNGLILDPLQIARSQTPSDYNHLHEVKSDMKSSKSSTTLSGAGSSAVESCVKDLVQRAFMPWIDRQIRVLLEASAKRRGLGNFFSSATRGVLRNMTSSTTSLTSTGSSLKQLTYGTECNEMQQRRLGDCFMMLNCPERAFNEFRQARRDFESDSGQVTAYWASASEACALSSYIAKTPQSRYFDDAIRSYSESGAILFATRAALIATELLRTLAPNEAAKLFISLTGEDSDLRSGLFLEQAAKCYLQAGTRSRKASFHYVLAANRYSKCGLRRHALHAFDRYHGSVAWIHAQENTAYAMVRLCLALENDTMQESYRERALSICADHSRSEIFFTELIRELSSRTPANGGSTPYLVKSPKITSIEWNYKDHNIQEDQLIAHKNPAKPSPCYIQEPIIVTCSMASHFAMRLERVRPMIRIKSRRMTGDKKSPTGSNPPTDSLSTQFVHCQEIQRIDLVQTPINYIKGDINVNDFNEQISSTVIYSGSQVTFKMTPLQECHFDVVGLEFYIPVGLNQSSAQGEEIATGVPLWVELSEKHALGLHFHVKSNLPLLDFRVTLNPFPWIPMDTLSSLSYHSGKTHLISNQLAQVTFCVGPNDRYADWRPSKLTLRSRADIFPVVNPNYSQEDVTTMIQTAIGNREPEENLFEGGKRKNRTFELEYQSSNAFYLLVPPAYDEALFTFTLAYHSDPTAKSLHEHGTHVPSHRSLTKSLDVALWNCLRMDSIIPLEKMNSTQEVSPIMGVVSLANELPAGYYTAVGSNLLPSQFHWIAQQYMTLNDATGSVLHIGPGGLGHVLLANSDAKTHSIPFKVTFVIGDQSNSSQETRVLVGILILRHKL